LDSATENYGVVFPSLSRTAKTPAAVAIPDDTVR
jgi:hypothetical protein